MDTKESEAHKVDIVAPASGSASPAQLLSPGTTFGAGYKVLELIGIGAVSQVYKAMHVSSVRTVALKILSVGSEITPGRTAMFAHNARLNIAHPNIVAVHACGLTDAGEPWLALEYLQGRTLREVLAEEGHLSAQQTIALFRPVLGALSYLHSQSELHMNLKPSNVLLLPRGMVPAGESPLARTPEYVKVADCGIGRLMLEAEMRGADEHAPAPASALYMSPEQFKGESIDARSDVYAVGCLLFHCLTGRPPHQGIDLLETMDRHLHAPVQFPSDPDVPFAIQAVLQRALEKEPENRYRTIAELQSDLDGALSGRQPAERRHQPSMAAYRTPIGIGPPRKKGNEPWLLLLTAITALLLITIAQQCLSLVHDMGTRFSERP